MASNNELKIEVTLDAKLFLNGVMTINEARVAGGLPSLPGGEVPAAPVRETPINTDVIKCEYCFSRNNLPVENCRHCGAPLPMPELAGEQHNFGPVHINIGEHHE